MSFGKKTQFTLGAALVTMAAISCVVAAEITQPQQSITAGSITIMGQNSLTPPTEISSIPLGAPAFDQAPHVDDSTIAKGEKLKKMADRLNALQKIVDDGESNLRTFRQSHGISATGHMQSAEQDVFTRINDKLLDMQIKMTIDQTRLETMKKRAADDKTLADFQETLDEDAAVVQLLQKSREDQARKLQDLDYFLEQYERNAAPTKALEATLLQMKLQYTLDSTAG